MNLRARTALVSLLLTSVPAAAQDAEKIAGFVRTEMTAQKIPGVAVAVIRKGQPIVVEGFGLANVEHAVRVTPDTIFQSGSVGKQFTSALVMLLVEEGRIALNDPLTKYFPDAPAQWQRITVRHLLTHTSGLPDYTAGTIDYRRDYTEDELQKFAYGLTPEFEPGARWNYSNTGYVLLGIIVHKASGQFYGDLLRERVFSPLGMKSARIITEEDIVPHRAGGYRLVRGELKNQQWVAPRLNTTADGSLYLSLRDFIAWDAAVSAGRVLSAASWAQVFAPVTLNSGKTYPYGFGWNVEAVAGHRAQRHGGSWQGFQTYIARYPDDDFSVLVLSNLAQGNPERIADGVAALVNPALANPPLAEIADADPETQALVRRLIGEAARGNLSPAEFAYVRAGFFPGGAAAYAAALKDAGPVLRLTLLERRELGDDRIYTYDVGFAEKTMRLRLALAPDGKIAQFSLR